MNADEYMKDQFRLLDYFKKGDDYVISRGLMEATLEAVYSKGVSDGFTQGIK